MWGRMGGVENRVQWVRGKVVQRRGKRRGEPMEEQRHITGGGFHQTRTNGALRRAEHSREGTYKGKRGRETNGPTGEIELGYTYISTKELWEKPYCFTLTASKFCDLGNIPPRGRQGPLPDSLTSLHAPSKEFLCK